MILATVLLLFLPLSATVAALVVGVMHRDESLEDAALVRHFLFVMVVVMLAASALGRTDGIRREIDPQYRIASELDADPVIKAVEAFDPDNATRLRGTVAAQVEAGATLPAALGAARPLLYERLRERIGFADPATQATWAAVVADSLEELESTRPQACWRVDAGAALDDDADEDAATQAFDFSADNDQDFMQAAVAVYESADRGMRREHPDSVVYPSADERQAAASALFEQLEADYGSDIVRALHDLDRRAPADVEWSQLCAARRAELEAILELPEPVAGSLADSVLR